MSIGKVQIRPIRSYHVWSLLLWGTLLPGGMLKTGSADDVPGAAEVTVETVGGETINGWLKSLNETLKLEGEEGPARQFERDAIIRLRPVDAAEQSARPQALVLLVNGDVLAGQSIRVGDELLSLAWSGPGAAVTVDVPLEFVRAIVFDQPSEQEQRQLLQRQWGLPRFGSDRLLLKSGTAIDGELNGLEGANIVLETGLGLVNTPRANGVGLTLNAELATPMPVTEEASIVLCADGSRVTLQDVAIDAAGYVSGTAAFGSEITLPLNQTTRVEFFSDRVQPLAEREPAAFEFTPFLAGVHPLVINRNVCGGPLFLRGSQFATGLGVHSRSEVTYDLRDEAWRSFIATIGVDDMTAGQGEVVFRVILDGEAVYDSGEVSGRSEPYMVGPIDVSGARRITLSVDFGRRGDMHDFANWCDPLLLR